MVTEGGYGLMAVIAAGVCECKERCGQCHCVILALIKDDRFAVSGVRLYLPALFTENPLSVPLTSAKISHSLQWCE